MSKHPSLKKRVPFHKHDSKLYNIESCDDNRSASLCHLTQAADGDNEKFIQPYAEVQYELLRFMRCSLKTNSDSKNCPQQFSDTLTLKTQT